MFIKSKNIFPALTILLLVILNVVFLSIVDIAIKSIYGNYNIFINYTIILIISAFGVSIISYQLTKKLSNNYIIIKEKNTIEKELKRALGDINKSNKEMQLEIADRKKIEKALVESEKQIRDIIQKAPAGIALLDKDGWILECNPALQNMLGYEEDE